MPSFVEGKAEVCEWIRANFSTKASILDVGACDGVWRKILPEYPNMDAVEIFEGNAKYLEGYRKVYCLDIKDFRYRHYDLIIFGDVIEHMSVKDAQWVLKYAGKRCKDMVVAVPFQYVQDEMYGNPYERHIQDDLTPELFNERYPGFEPLVDPGLNYMYYHKKEKKKVKKKFEKGLIAEPSKDPRVMVAIPGMDTAPLLFTRSLLGLRLPANAPFGFALSSLVYDARNSLVVDAINGRFDRVLWLDTDMVFDPDLFERLNKIMDDNNADMVTGLYFSRKAPLEPVIYKKCEMKQDDKGQLTKEVEKYLDYPEDKVFPIAGCGFGGCLMKTDLAIKVLQHYGSAFAPLPGFGEDLSFCLRANDMGAKILCDSSIKLQHIGYTFFNEDDYKQLREEAKNG